MPLGLTKTGITGTNQQKNIIMMLVAMVVPFYLIMGTGFIVALSDLPIWATALVFVCGFMGWGFSINTWYVRAKSRVSSYYCFESAKVHYSETQVSTLDLKFYPDQIKKCDQKTPDGRDVICIPFTETYIYDHPTYGQVLWNKAFIILPFPDIPFKHTFSFNNTEPLWEMGMMASCPNCEGASFHVSPFWDEIEGEYIPYFMVADSHIHYVLAKAKMLHLDRDAKLVLSGVDEKGFPVTKEIVISELDDKVDAMEYLQSKIIGWTSEMTGLKLKVKRLEKDRKKLLEEKLDVANESVKRYITTDNKIMEDKPSTLTRITNMKWLGYGLLAIGVLGTIIFVSNLIWG